MHAKFALASSATHMRTIKHVEKGDAATTGSGRQDPMARICMPESGCLVAGIWQRGSASQDLVPTGSQDLKSGSGCQDLVATMW